MRRNGIHAIVIIASLTCAVAVPARGLAPSPVMENLARFRAAPEHVVLEAAAELTKTISRTSIADRDALVEQYAVRVLGILGPTTPREEAGCRARPGVIVRPFPWLHP